MRRAASYSTGPLLVHRRERKRPWRALGFWEILVLLVVLSIGGAWLFARERPVRVVRREPEPAAARTVQASCGVCGGSGRVPSPFGERGAGPFTSARDRMCTACGGTGRAAPARGAAADSPALVTVREEFSLWERLLVALTLTPPENPRPIRLWGGRMPLVEAFLDLHVPGARMDRNAGGRFERRNDQWEAVLVALAGPEENPIRRHLHFVVRNREIVECRVVQ